MFKSARKTPVAIGKFWHYAMVVRTKKKQTKKGGNLVSYSALRKLKTLQTSRGR